jgi:ribosomal protein L37E
MGGYGSGRTSQRGVLENCLLLDMNLWNRQAKLRGHSSGIWQWAYDDGEVVSTISYTATPELVELSYRADKGTEAEKHMLCCVAVAWTPCHFGGRRPWFQCPNTRCQRLCSKLYLHGGHFICRRCTGRAYQSQRETSSNRLFRKARKMRRRLGASMNLTEPVWRKPKGMHWRIFERLREEARRVSHLSIVTAARELGIGV